MHWKFEMLPKGIQIANYPDGSEELSFEIDRDVDVSGWTEFLQNGTHSNDLVHHLLVSCSGTEAPDWQSVTIKAWFRTLGESLPNLVGIRLENLGIDRDFPVNLLAELLLAKRQLEYLRFEFGKLAGGCTAFLSLGSAIEQLRALKSFQMLDAILSGRSPHERCSMNVICEKLSNLPALERLHIRALPMNEPTGSLGRLGHACSSLGSSRSLTRINLENFDFSEDHLLALTRSLDVVEEINVSYYSLRDCSKNSSGSEFCKQLTNAFWETQSLEIFRLGVLDDPNLLLKTLAPALAFQRTIRELVVFDGEGAATEATAKHYLDILLSSNIALQLLQLPRYYGELLPTIELYLKLNRFGIRDLLQNTEGGDLAPEDRRKWIDALENVSTDLDCIFFLILSNPVPFVCS